MNEKRNAILFDAVRTWDRDAQALMMIEEMSELTKAICKFHRVNDDSSAAVAVENIREEMADVQIMLDQMKIMFGDPEDQEREKLERLERRLEAAHKKNGDDKKDCLPWMPYSQWVETYQHCRECICQSCDLFRKDGCLEGANHCDMKCDHKSHTMVCPWHPNERERQT